MASELIEWILQKYQLHALIVLFFIDILDLFFGIGKPELYNS